MIASVMYYALVRMTVLSAFYRHLVPYEYHMIRVLILAGVSSVKRRIGPDD